MDSVRFGRALGVGARAAAKTLVTAVDAATSPNPSAGGAAKGASGPSSVSSSSSPDASKAQASGERVTQRVARTATQVQQTRKGLKEGGKRFGEAAWGPVAKLSGVLWLEVTGVFFGVFALFAGGGVWKMRGSLHDIGANHKDHVHLLLSIVMAAVFGYFCVSSFVKANRRGKRH